jgi:hypothetical protein
MSFEDRIVAFSERFLCDRTFELVVAPALADLEFDPGRKPFTRAINRAAVLRAVVGGLAHDVKRDSGSFVLLTLMPTCYYMSLLVLCFDAVKTWSGFLSLAAMVVALSCAPVLVCFWPSRRPAPTRQLRALGGPRMRVSD